MALAQLLAQGPIHTVIRVHTQRYKPASLLHVLTTSIGGLVNPPLFLALSAMACNDRFPRASICCHPGHKHGEFYDM